MKLYASNYCGGFEIGEDKVVSKWKRKEVKRVVRAAKKPIFRRREMKGTGPLWGSKSPVNRSDKRKAQKGSK